MIGQKTIKNDWLKKRGKVKLTNNKMSTPSLNNTHQLTQPTTNTTFATTTTSTTTSNTLNITIFGSHGNGNAQFNYPNGIVYDNKQQHILVADCYNHHIQIWNKQRQYVNQFGSQGSQHGQFQYPYQLSLHPLTNHILVADSNNHRVQIFNEQGEFVTVIGQSILQYPYAVDCHSTLSNNNNQLPQHIVAADFNHQIHLFSISHNNHHNTNHTLHWFDCDCCHDYKRIVIMCNHGCCCDYCWRLKTGEFDV